MRAASLNHRELRDRIERVDETQRVAPGKELPAHLEESLTGLGAAQETGEEQARELGGQQLEDGYLGANRSGRFPVRTRRRPRRWSLTARDPSDLGGYAATFCSRARFQFQGSS